MNMQKKTLLALTLTASSALCSFAHAQASMKYGPATPEVQFVHKAAQGGLAEVELSRVAASRSPSESIRNFANEMVQAHTENNAKLQQIAQSEGIALPSEPDSDHVALRNKLSAATGVDIDRIYVQAMRRDHQGMLDLLNANVHIDDPQLRAFVADTKPVVEHHLQMANKLTGP